jgi:hypothetical protein
MNFTSPASILDANSNIDAPGQCLSRRAAVFRLTFKLGSRTFRATAITASVEAGGTR